VTYKTIYKSNNQQIFRIMSLLLNLNSCDMIQTIVIKIQHDHMIHIVTPLTNDVPSRDNWYILLYKKLYFENVNLKYSTHTTID
jgi:hypothetical protein